MPSLPPPHTYLPSFLEGEEGPQYTSITPTRYNQVCTGEITPTPAPRPSRPAYVRVRAVSRRHFTLNQPHGVGAAVGAIRCGIFPGLLVFNHIPRNATQQNVWVRAISTVCIYVSLRDERRDTSVASHSSSASTCRKRLRSSGARRGPKGYLLVELNSTVVGDAQNFSRRPPPPCRARNVLSSQQKRTPSTPVLPTAVAVP